VCSFRSDPLRCLRCCSLLPRSAALRSLTRLITLPAFPLFLLVTTLPRFAFAFVCVTVDCCALRILHVLPRFVTVTFRALVTSFVTPRVLPLPRLRFGFRCGRVYRLFICNTLPLRSLYTCCRAYRMPVYYVWFVLHHVHRYYHCSAALLRFTFTAPWFTFTLAPAFAVPPLICVYRLLVTARFVIPLLHTRTFTRVLFILRLRSV